MGPNHPDFNAVFSHLIRWEGTEYVNDPDDPGEETKFGISARAYPNVDIKGLNKQRAKEIYFEDYWKGSHAPELPEGIRLMHFDTAVNTGKGKAMEILQRAAGSSPDGIWGPNTKAAVQKGVNLWVYTAYRLKHYLAIIGEDHTLAKYASGWKRRTMDTLKAQQEWES